MTATPRSRATSDRPAARWPTSCSGRSKAAGSRCRSPVSGDSPFPFGDPSLAMDRRGNIYYASLGTDAAGNGALIVNKSADNGSTFGTASVVVLDEGSDKEWLAIGPDPKVRGRDNLYV